MTLSAVVTRLPAISTLAQVLKMIPTAAGALEMERVNLFADGIYIKKP